jgi:hypothetical protein
MKEINKEGKPVFHLDEVRALMSQTAIREFRKREIWEHIFQSRRALLLKNNNDTGF